MSGDEGVSVILRWSLARTWIHADLSGLPAVVTEGADTGGGFWLPAMVTETKDVSEPVWRDEVFGPLVAVMPFDDEDEAIALANDSDYGLSGSIYTHDLGRALRVSRGVQTGNLSVNSHSSVRYWTPFGGYKMSGVGRELEMHALELYTELKNVFVDLT